MENTERSKQWRKIISQAYSANPLFKYEIKNHTKICSRHFIAADFQLLGEGKIHLGPFAVPSLFPDIHKYIPPREYYNPFRDDGDDVSNIKPSYLAALIMFDISQQEEQTVMKFQQEIPRSMKRPMIEIMGNSHHSSESLLISNQKRKPADIIVRYFLMAEELQTPNMFTTNICIHSRTRQICWTQATL